MSVVEQPRFAGAIRYETIGAWRGIACLAVVVFHSFGAFYHTPIWAPLKPLRALSEFGWLGLHLFFVISGYCIFERLAAAKRHGETTRNFWLDRALRVLPGYWIALAASIALSLAAWPFNTTPLLANLPRSLAAGLADLSLTHVFLGLPAYILVSWTLACEVAFYFLAGLMLWTARRTGAGLTAAFGLGAVLCVPGMFLSSAGWSLVLAAWPDFFAGVCVSFLLRSVHQRDWRLTGAGIAALAALTALTLLNVGSYGSDARKFSVGFAWVLFGLHWCDAWLARLLLVRALAWIGVFSYSLYLVHVQVLTRVINLGGRVLLPTSPFFAALWVGAVGVAITAGWLFWRLVENRAEQYRHGRRRMLLQQRPFSTVVAPVAGSP